MDNRYRDRNNQTRGNHDRQQEQFGGGQNRQYGADDYGYRQSRQGNRDRYSQGSYSGGNRGNYGERYSQNSDYDSLSDYDQQSQSYGRSQYGSGSQNYRDDDYGRSGMDQSRQSYGGSYFGGGYGDMGRNDYYGGSSYGRGGDSDRDRTRTSYYAGEGGRHRGRSFDRDNDRGFFDRMGDKIESWFGGDDDDRHRDNDRYGRSGGYRGHGPTNYKRSDERILEDACDRITHDPRVDGRNIEVTVKDGEVTLDGTVDSRAAKRRAEDCVDDISGVKHVQNNLRVKERSSWSSGTDSYDSSRSGIGDYQESRTVKRDSDATNKATSGSGATPTT